MLADLAEARRLFSPMGLEEMRSFYLSFPAWFLRTWLTTVESCDSL